MSAQSYAGQNRAIPSGQSLRKGRGDGETLFGLVLALATLYGLGTLVAFLVSWAVK